MKIQAWLSRVRQTRVVAVIRASALNDGLASGKAVAAGGIRVLEVTWNSDRPEKLIPTLQEALPDCMVGAGTILSMEQAKQAIAAGAQFLFTPHTNVRLIHIAIDQNIPIVVGALTPTEIVAAWQAGATCVKVFPIQALGGASYIQQLQGPLNEILLIPTGGVTLKNARQFLQAGAFAIGLSGDLFPKENIESNDWTAVTNRAEQLVLELKEWSTGQHDSQKVPRKITSF